MTNPPPEWGPPPGPPPGQWGMPPPPPAPPGAWGVPPPPNPYAYPPPAYGYQAYGNQASYANFGSRFGAFVIDMLITAVPIWVVFAVLFFSEAGSGDPFGCSTVPRVDGTSTLHCSGGFVTYFWLWWLLAMAAFVLIGYFYFVRPVARGGQTLGQKVTHVRVVDLRTGGPIGTGRAIGRYLMRSFVSGAICYLGFLWMLWDPQCQTWHDKVAESIVVRA